MTDEDLKRTPLYEVHRELGAKFVPFGGWEMPVQYSSLKEEHLAVRRAAGLFDVSHMGEIEITGEAALPALQHLITNDAARLDYGGALYTPICYDSGGVVDDCIVYCVSREAYLLCVNASNTDKVFEWVRANNPHGAVIKNVSGNFCQLALQGPASVDILSPLVKDDLSKVKYFNFISTELLGSAVIIARTGYTGEDGFEIYGYTDKAVEIWKAIMESGREYGILPIGLGARDTLRLEMGYPLYGHELSENRTPVEAGLWWCVKTYKDEYIGKAPIEERLGGGPEESLVGYIVTGKGIGREGYDLYDDREGTRRIGTVTSGTMSPSLGKAVGMAYVHPSLKEPGTEIFIKVRDKLVSAEVVKRPIYKKEE